MTTAIQKIREVYESDIFEHGVDAEALESLGEALGAITTPDATPISPGAELVLDERLRQITEEGYDAKHDEGHAAQLAGAGVSYAGFSHVTLKEGFSPDEALLVGGQVVPPFWPWSSINWKPTGDPKRDLVKAAALFVAAVDALIAEEGN